MEATGVSRWLHGEEKVILDKKLSKLVSGLDPSCKAQHILVGQDGMVFQ
jgi:hypothetical protein